MAEPGASEIDPLRQQSFRVLLLLLAVAGWLALQAGYAAAPMSPYMWLGVLAAFGGGCSAYMLARRSFRLASLWLVAILALALSFTVLAFPRAPLRFYAALIPLAGALIMPASDTWLALALAVGSLLGIESLAPRAAVGYRSLVAPLGLAILTYGLAVLLSRSLRTAASWALEHQVLARKHAEEARSRRADLARAFKALDEAWHRLERMNNELIHAREEAEQARRLKAEFAAHVSHELRTPLNIVLGFSRMMLFSPESYGGEPLPPAYRGDMLAIHRGSQYLSNLVDDILDLSRVEAGRMRIFPRKLSLRRDVIEETVAVVRSLAEAKGIELRVEAPEDLPAVHGDPVRLRQVLLNLANNAIRFTERGHVAIRAAAEAGAVRVSVEDTGRGMAPADVEKAFEAFQQVWTEAEAAEGTGLGLAISRLLIQLHGGRIWVESQVGKGTAVHFTLPAAEQVPACRAAQPSEGRAWLAAGREERYCLLVSPDPLAAQVLERHLLEGAWEGPEHRLIHLRQVEEVSRAVERFHPRAVIVDERLGVSAAEVGAGFPYDVPIVTCAIPSEAEVSLSLGAVAHLRKPVEEQALLAAVEALGPQVSTILIVDDDRWMVRLLSRILQAASRPYRLLEAFSADEALALMREMRPDAVLLDVVMPGKDGYAVLREMKADPDLAAIPAIMVSGAGRPQPEQAEPSLFAVARKSRLTTQEIAEALRAVLTSMSPDYLDPRPSAAGPPEAPAG